MIELNPGIERSGKKLIFTSGKSKRGFLGIIVFAAIFVFVAVSESTSSDLRGGGAFLLVLFACILLLDSSRQWIAEFDLAARRIRIFRRSFGRWTKITVDCPFDQCSALGTFEYDSDGHRSYSVYVRSQSGTRHTIPTTNSTLNEAARVASELAASTGIPRLDIYVGPIYDSPDDNTSRRGG